MTSNQEELDAAEKNILYLNELKSVITAKIQLLKLKQTATEPKEYSESSLEQENKRLTTSLLKKSQLDDAIFHILLKTFITDNVTNNEEPQVQEYKEKLYEGLKELNQSTISVQILLKTIRTLTTKQNELQKEISVLRNKNEKIIAENSKSASRRNEDEPGKELLASRVEKINLMMKIINGLMCNTKQVKWSDDPAMLEIIKMCRSEYKLN